MTEVTHVTDSVLRCASRRCGVVVHGFDADHFAGVYSCTRCGARNFAIRFAVGNSDVQVAAAIGSTGDALLDAIMLERFQRQYRIREIIAAPIWLSVWIPNDQFSLYRHDIAPGRAGRLFQRVFA